VNLQEATGEPGIRVAEYCLVIDRWHLPLWPWGDKQRSEVMLWVTRKDVPLNCRGGQA